MKTWIIGIAIVIGLSATIWVLRHPDVVEPSPEIVSASNVGADVNETANLTVAEQVVKTDLDPQNPEVVKAFEFSNATSAASAFEIIEAAFANGNGDFGLWAESELNFYCYGIGEMRSSPHEASQWSFDKLKDYCVDFDPSMTQRYQESIIAGTHTIQRQMRSIENAARDLPPAEKYQLLSQFIASSETAYEIMAGFRVLDKWLEVPGTPLPNIGQDPGISEHDFIAAQYAASNLLECRVTGWCRPDSARMLTLCAMSIRCDPGWGVYELMEHTLSPLQMEQVVKMVEYFTNYGKG